MTGASRVVHVIADLRVGGAQQLLVSWAKEARRRDEPVTVVSLSADVDQRVGTQLVGLGAEVVVVDGKQGSAGLLTQVARLQVLLLRRAPAVVQTHLTRAHLVGLVAGKLAGVPTVATLHNARVGHDGNSSRALLAETFLLRRSADVVVACGAVVEASQRERLRPSSAVVVANATEASEPLPEYERSALRRSVLGEECAELPLVLAVGRLTEQKGYEDLLPAFAQVVRRLPSVLVVAGGGSPDEAAVLLALVRHLRLEDRVRLLGPRDDVPDLLRCADLYVSASRWEGLPIALLEAMAAGLPSVVTDVGDVSTVMDPACGNLVPPQDVDGLARGMLELLADPSRRDEMGQASAARVAAVAGLSQWYDAMRSAHVAACAFKRGRRRPGR